MIDFGDDGYSKASTSITVTAHHAAKQMGIMKITCVLLAVLARDLPCVASPAAEEIQHLHDPVNLSQKI